MLDQLKVQEVALVTVKEDQQVQDEAKIGKFRVLGCLWYPPNWEVKPQ